ncbi:LAMI_0G02168g1_1 [Lachancea mirantina]|uniref:LAMI_0G02168g1_1 n=1 Tax=Lachancea mirantina TaxID=1230905 RepID=A0A1G4K7V8_9SACH|nr:LAMI_0G02168g1_1 [Lachancea mirantina]
MKINSTIYDEAHKLALRPRMKLLFYGVLCGAAVPTMYLRTYYMPKVEANNARDVKKLGNQVNQLQKRAAKIEDSVVSGGASGAGGTGTIFSEAPIRTSENLGLLGGVGDIPLATWHIGGRNRYANDENYRKLVDEANAIMFSSIM